MITYIFGNGNISFEEFERGYAPPIRQSLEAGSSFILCDFRGADTLAMEYLKTKTHKVTILHVGDKPRYFPDKFRTHVSQWDIMGAFPNDASRDQHAINHCTHFIATDFNSTDKRTSGTQKNIEACVALGRIKLEP